jgi:hypothetical protein
MYVDLRNRINGFSRVVKYIYQVYKLNWRPAIQFIGNFITKLLIPRDFEGVKKRTNSKSHPDLFYIKI